MPVIATHVIQQNAGVFALGGIQDDTGDSDGIDDVPGRGSLPAPNLPDFDPSKAPDTGVNTSNTGLTAIADAETTAQGQVAFMARIRTGAAPAAKASTTTGPGPEETTADANAAEPAFPAPDVVSAQAEKGPLQGGSNQHAAVPASESPASSDAPGNLAPPRASSEATASRTRGASAGGNDPKDPGAVRSAATDGSARQESGRDPQEGDARKGETTEDKSVAAVRTPDDALNPPFQPPVSASSQTDANSMAPQSAGRSEPAQVVETPATATPVRAPAAARDIALELPNPGGPRVDIQLTDRGGEVRVVVRTEDADLARDLRSNLPELSQKLSQSGMEAETVSPVEAHVLGGGRDSLGQHNRQGSDDSHSPSGGSRDSGSSQHGRQQQRRETADKDETEGQFSGFLSGVFK